MGLIGVIYSKEVGKMVWWMLFIIEVMDTLAPEHLEILTGDNDYYLKHLKNYGSLFIGEWSTVSYADKGTTGTNHVLPTGGGAKYTSGLSVGRFLKPVTYQTSTRESTMQVAPHNSAIAGFFTDKR